MSKRMTQETVTPVRLTAADLAELRRLEGMIYRTKSEQAPCPTWCPRRPSVCDPMEWSVGAPVYHQADAEVDGGLRLMVLAQDTMKDDGTIERKVYLSVYTDWGNIDLTPEQVIELGLSETLAEFEAGAAVPGQ